MVDHRKRLKQDAALILLSVFAALLLVRSGILYESAGVLKELNFLGAFLAGLLFTSVFTTAPAIVVIAAMAAYTPLPILFIFGGLGAMLGDYIIFRFIKTRILDDFEYLLSFAKHKRLRLVFHRRLFHSLFMFLGALVLASPFPDEIGLAMLGLSKVKNKTFFLLSFSFNAVGIALIALAGRAAV